MTDPRHLNETTLDRLRTGELPAAEAERARAHLAQCPACGAAAAELAAFAGVVRQGYAAEDAAGAAGEPDWAAQREAILARTRPGRSRGWPAARWIPQVAAVLVAVVAVGVVVERGVRGPEDAERIRHGPAPAAVERADAPEEAPGEPPLAAESAPAPTPANEAAGSRATARRDAQDADGTPPATPPPPPAAVEGEAAAGKADRQQAPPEADDALADRPPREEAAAELLRERRADAAADRLATPLDRFFARGRVALALEDSLQAARALALWRDTLATGGVQPAEAAPERLAAARALADSLAVWLGDGE